MEGSREALSYTEPEKIFYYKGRVEKAYAKLPHMVAMPLYCAVYRLIIPTMKIMSASNQVIHQLILWSGQNLSARSLTDKISSYDPGGPYAASPIVLCLKAETTNHGNEITAEATVEITAEVTAVITTEATVEATGEELRITRNGKRPGTILRILMQPLSVSADLMQPLPVTANLMQALHQTSHHND